MRSGSTLGEDAEEQPAFTEKFTQLLDREESGREPPYGPALDIGIEMRLVQGDVTALRQTEVGSDFELVLDTGTFHGLNSAQREAMGHEISAATSHDAIVLMLAFEAPKPVELLMGPDERWYRLHRD